MKKIKILTFTLCLTIAGLVTAAFVNSTPANTPANKPVKLIADGKGFAVVELFTSEGCSSCPSADAVVAKIEKEVSDKPVYILAYHVDYWNRLGWKDVFSSADYSKRQNTYANWLNLSSVYTPQVIVNGKTEFVGSQEGTLRNAITAGINKGAKTELSLSNVKTSGNELKLNYSVDKATGGSSLVVALVQKNATTVVKNGENGGRTLAHVQIVKNIQTIAVGDGKSGDASIALPANFASQKWEVIAFVQNSRNGEISAATKYALTANVSASN